MTQSEGKPVIRLRLNLGTAAQRAGEPSTSAQLLSKPVLDDTEKDGRNGLKDMSWRGETIHDVASKDTLSPSPSRTRIKRIREASIHESNENEPPANQVNGTTTNSKDLPLKLTVRLKQTDHQPQRQVVFSVKKDEEPPAKEEEKKTNVAAINESIDIETVDKPSKKTKVNGQRGGRPKTSVGQSEATVTTVAVANAITTTLATTVANPMAHLANIPAVAKPINSTGGPKVPMASLRPTNMTRVPIAALSSFVALSPGEREEERIFRQCLADTFGNLWPMVINPDLEETFSSWKDVQNKIVPYWLALAPIDSTYNNSALRTASNAVAATEQDPQEKLVRLTTEVEKLHLRYQDSVMKEKNKDISSELLVLEQRLCLEEEKFLYAKLKSEYNTMVGELIAKKRQVEGISLPPPNPQRILPKVNSSWAAGSGIQILRGTASSVSTPKEESATES